MLAVTNRLQPRFSLIVAAYNVARFLPDFIESITSQDFDLGRVEIIAINDGSTDGTLGSLEAWKQHHPGLVTVVSQDNAGQADARNHGLELATGDWVGFPDPDDLLATDYLSRVDAFLSGHLDVDMIATNRVLLRDATGNADGEHALSRFFGGGDRLRDLDTAGVRFHNSASAAFFKTDRIKDFELRFDSRIRPIFEDNHFVIAYLCRSPSRKVGFLQSAKYVYRKRSDESSSVQTSLQDPRRYTDVFEFGYLEALELAREAYGHVPFWVQNNLLYELYHAVSPAVTGAQTAELTPQANRRFNDLMSQVLAGIDPGTISQFRFRAARLAVRDALLHSWADGDWHASYAVIEEYDSIRKEAKVVYRFKGRAPTEQFSSAEQEVQPTHAKYRSFELLGQRVLSERIAWVPVGDGSLSVRVDGTLIEFLPKWPAPSQTRIGKSKLKQWHEPQDAQAVTPDPSEAPASGRRFALRKRSSRRNGEKERARLDNAWVLIDRPDQANDNAEYLFRYLRRERADVNAWFTLQADSSDWPRLASEFGERLVAYDTDAWRALMARCSVLVSSSSDPDILEPASLRDADGVKWRSVLIQTGLTGHVTGADLNRRKIDRICVSTQSELRAIVADGSQFAYTDKETVLTEQPRFDDLFEVSRRRRHSAEDLLMFAPVWAEQPRPSSTARHRGTDDPEEAATPDLVSHWVQLMASSEIQSVATQHNISVCLISDSSWDTALTRWGLPDSVRIIHPSDPEFDGAGEPIACIGHRLLGSSIRCGVFGAGRDLLSAQEPRRTLGWERSQWGRSRPTRK